MSPTTATTELVERVVTADAHSWMEPTGYPPNSGLPLFAHRTARRGETVEVSAAEADRGERLGSLGSVEQAAARNAAAAEPPPWGDEQLASATVEDVTAYVQQRPSEADRVLEAEALRARPRKTVMEPVTAMRDAYLAALEEAADAERQAAEDDDETAGSSATAPAPGAPKLPA